MTDHADLERRLADLGAHIEFPSTPSIARSVIASIRALDESGGRRDGAWRRLVAVAMLAVLVVITAAAAWLSIGGLRLNFSDGRTPLPSAIVSQRALGESVSLDAARARAGFEIRLPTLASLGEPDHVYFREPPAAGQVSLVYGARPGYPASSTTADVGVVVTAFRADIGPDSFEKMVSSGARVMPAQVAGIPAWWVEGGSHYFFYRDAAGRAVEDTVRLVGDTLIWEQEGVTYRVEGAPGLEEAIAVGESME
jgi:hypothetical protein